MYLKPLKTDRMYYAMITDRETSAVCLTAPSCGCLGDNCKPTEVHIPHAAFVSCSVLCLDWRNNVFKGMIIYDVYFFN